jgi:hypothetical protein
MHFAGNRRRHALPAARAGAVHASSQNVFGGETPPRSRENPGNKKITEVIRAAL